MYSRIKASKNRIKRVIERWINQITLFPEAADDYTLDWEDGEEVIICIKEKR